MNMKSKDQVVGFYAAKLAMETIASAGWATSFCRDIVDAMERLNSTPLTGEELRTATAPLVATNNSRINAFAEKLVAAIVRSGELSHVGEHEIEQIILTIRKLACEPEWQQPNIEPHMALSTAHLSPAAKAWLDECSQANARAVEKNDIMIGGSISTCGVTLHGWFTHASEGYYDSDTGRPPELAAIFDYARSHECAYILFDADADAVDDLPTWEDDGRRVEAEVNTPGAYENRLHGLCVGTPLGITNEMQSAMDAFARAGAPASVVAAVGRFYGEDAGIADELAEPGELDPLTAYRLRGSDRDELRAAINAVPVEDDAEIEQRQTGTDTGYWQSLKTKVDRLRAAAKLI